MQVVLFASVVLVLLPLFLAKVFILDTLHSSMSSEVDENLQRLAGMKGAIGGLVMTMEGEMIRSTLDTSTTSWSASSAWPSTNSSVRTTSREMIWKCLGWEPINISLWLFLILNFFLWWFLILDLMTILYINHISFSVFHISFQSGINQECSFLDREYPYFTTDFSMFHHQNPEIELKWKLVDSELDKCQR